MVFIKNKQAEDLEKLLNITYNEALLILRRRREKRIFFFSSRRRHTR